MSIRDLTIRTKVYGAFAIVLTLDILTGAAAHVGLSMVTTKAAQIREVWLPGLVAAGDLSSAVENYRIIEGRTLLTLDESEFLASEEMLWNARDQVFRLRTAYGRARPAEDREIGQRLDSFDVAWQRYQTQSKRMIAHAFGGERNLAAARDIYNDAAANFSETAGQLKALTAYSLGQASQATERSRRIETISTASILLVAVGTTIVSWLLGLFIVGSVTKPVADITRAMRRMADDDLTAGGVATGSRRDEIGIMATALQELRNRLLERRRLIDEEKANLIKLQAVERELLDAERLASLGRMVAGVSHEINTPLGSAYTVATTLVEAHREFGAQFHDNRLRRSDLDAFADRVGRAGNLLVMTLQKANELIRTFKQVAVDQTSSSRRRFDLGELVRQVVLTTTPLFKHKPHRLVQEIPEGIELDSFPGPLGQVLSNLLDNAVTHGLDGLADGTVTITAWRDADGMVAITVADDGKGIQPQHQGHLFEPFFTTRFGQGGSGLGLNIVHGIVTNVLGGTIDVASRPGEGATFAVTIPTRAPDRASSGPAEGPLGAPPAAANALARSTPCPTTD